MTQEDHNGRQEHENFEGRLGEHIGETTLVLYLDHELPAEDSARVRSHLQCCAECRQLEAELSQASVAFSSLQHDFDETLPAPPQSWAAFEHRLAGVLADEEHVLRESRWKRFWNARPRENPGTPILAWSLAIAAAGLLVGYLQLHQPANPTLSFNEIMNRIEQESTISPSPFAPVVYRKLRISVSSAPNLPITVELWRRTSDGRIKESVKESEASQAVAASARRPTKQPVGHEVSPTNRSVTSASDSGLLAQLNELYAANHLDWTEPISSIEFKRWADSDGPKEEQVVRENLPDGGEAYRLIARAKNPLISSQRDLLSEMQLVVRSSDWHTIAERLTVQAPSGVRTYEVAELEYREMLPSEVPASIFEPRSLGTALAGDLPRAPLGIQPLSGVALTVEVLSRLDALDALVKDQVEITHAGAEGLKLEGTVGSDQRKTEILAALGTLASNPALELDLVSPSEARDRASRSTGHPSQIQSIQVPLEGSGSNAYLRNWLAEHRGVSRSQLDSEAERFQMEAVVLSTDAQLQAQALKHILTVVPTAPVDDETAEKWRRLVNHHAEAAQQQVQDLERHLAPVFRSASSPHTPSDSKPQNLEDLTAEAERLVDLVTASDRVLWQAFSGDGTDSDQRQLTDPKFWLMLEEEDSLATHLKREAHP
ncbi:MAG TPA: zf-HC2 domain-containing protein [Terracidiphilus sp.]|nr:zf-HC2 domain-containing protein [Terracidiphilus sp.]